MAIDCSWKFVIRQSSSSLHDKRMSSMFFPFRELGNVIGAEGVAVVGVVEVEVFEPVGATGTGGIDGAAVVEVVKGVEVVGVVFGAPNKPVVAGVVVVEAGALEGKVADDGAAGGADVDVVAVEVVDAAAAAVLEPKESADGGVIGLAAVAAPKLKDGLLALEDGVVVAGVVGLKPNVGEVAGLAAEAEPNRVEVGVAGVAPEPKVAEEKGADVAFEPKAAVPVVSVVGAAPKAVLVAGLAPNAGVVAGAGMVLKLKLVVPDIPEPNVAVAEVAAAGFADEAKELEANAAAGVVVDPKAGLESVDAEPKVTAGALESVLMLEGEQNAVDFVGATPVAAPEEFLNEEEPKANVAGVPEEPNALGVALAPEEVPNEVLPKPLLPLPAPVIPKAEELGGVPELVPKGVGGIESFFFSPPKPLPNI